MTKWEYKWERPGEISPEYVNNLGGRGWEWGGTLGGDWIIFKRPVKPQMPALIVVNGSTIEEFEQLADAIKAELSRFGFERDDVP